MFVLHLQLLRPILGVELYVYLGGGIYIYIYMVIPPPQKMSYIYIEGDTTSSKKNVILGFSPFLAATPSQNQDLTPKRNPLLLKQTHLFRRLFFGLGPKYWVLAQGYLHASQQPTGLIGYKMPLEECKYRVVRQHPGCLQLQLSDMTTGTDCISDPLFGIENQLGYLKLKKKHAHNRVAFGAKR